MNRLQVIERLQLGRAVEGELPPNTSRRRCFVHVRPVIDACVAEFQSCDPFIEPLLLRANPNGNVVKEYVIHFYELNSGWEREPDDWDHFIHRQEKLVFSSLGEVEQELGRRGLCLDALQVPGNTDSPL